MVKKFLRDFQSFIQRGNVVDLAVGVIIGAAFQGIVKSLTDNILSPVIGLLAGQNFDTLQLDFFGISLRYGAFITSVVNFLITAFVIFLFISLLSRLKVIKTNLIVDDKDKTPTTKECPFCLSTINIKATRCPHCTSLLEEEKTEET